MVIASVVTLFIVINYMIFLSLAKAAGSADRRLKEIHKAFFSGEEKKRGGNFNSDKQVGE